jgi:putative molybdopterin biosynthesis protein
MDTVKIMLSTKEVARYLGVNEKLVYTLISEKGLPASKVTGKWLFPQHLVAQWVEAHTQNIPQAAGSAGSDDRLLVMAGSNDPLLEQAISLHNSHYADGMAVFGNLGSMGGVRALKQRLCQIATSHLLQQDGDDYNFDFIQQDFLPPPVVVNFCRRCQGLVTAKGNPKQIGRTADLQQQGLCIVNRKLGTGTRLLFDRELKNAGLKGDDLPGYLNEVARHMDVGLAVLSGRADAGPCIQPVAELLGLSFIPWRWERYDLLILKERFFNPEVQRFLSLLHDKAFLKLADGFQGYDLSISGQMVFPADSATVENQS